MPLSHILLYESKPEVLEGIITQDLKLDVIAGIPALGRAADVQNLLSAVQEAAAIVPPLVQLDRRIDQLKVIDMIMAGQSVDTSILHKSDEQMQAENEAEQQMQDGQQQMVAAEDAAVQAEQLQQLQQGI